MNIDVRRPAVIVCLALCACVTTPERRDPMAGTGTGGAPAYPDVKIALVLSDNTKNAIAYGREGAKHADFDPDRLHESDLDVFRRNFGTVTPVDTLDAAARAPIDLIVIVDNYVKVGTSVAIEDGAIFLKPNRDKVAEIRAKSDRMIGLFNPGEVITATAQESRLKLEAGLRGSPELARFARESSSAKASLAPAQTAMPALRTPTKLIVVPLRPVGSVTKDLCQLLTSLLLAKLSTVPGLTTIGESDIQAMLGIERQKDLLGCGDAVCMAEIGGALGADLVLHGEVGTLGASYNLNFSVVRSATSSVATRTSRVVTRQGDEALEGELAGMVRDIVTALNGTP